MNDKFIKVSQLWHTALSFAFVIFACFSHNYRFVIPSIKSRYDKSTQTQYSHCLSISINWKLILSGMLIYNSIVSMNTFFEIIVYFCSVSEEALLDILVS